ncbi:MAG: DUF2179 domain-containing protein [Syntrophomonadaceae bacterium]|jgi:uncharacterized protein YebE (UPF0316 family)|nr:DUF2179 domain-containing protein [Syntrophomonadaceae bacterium]
MLFDLAFIFFARIIDVSLGTVRMILTIRGERYIAAVIGFFEIMVYVVALGKVIGSLDEPVKLILYCLGFASGVIVGSWLEGVLALGYQGIQVIMDNDNQELVEQLREEGYAITTWKAEGLSGPKLVLNLVVKRGISLKIAERIREHDEHAFIVFMEPKSFAGGYFKKK